MLAEALNALAVRYFPDDVASPPDGAAPKVIVDEEDIPALLRLGLAQAGIGNAEISAQVLQVRIEHLERDIDRVERDALTEGRVLALVLPLVGVLFAIGVALSRNL